LNTAGKDTGIFNIIPLERAPAGALKTAVLKSVVFQNRRLVLVFGWRAINTADQT